LRGRHHTSLCDMETSESQIQQHRQASWPAIQFQPPQSVQARSGN
jgi:hypothetical protein